MRRNMTVFITSHALRRYRERAAEYGDAGYRELETRFRANAVKAPGNVVPGSRVWNGSDRRITIYRDKDDISLYYVARWDSPTNCVLVSIVVNPLVTGRALLCVP